MRLRIFFISILTAITLGSLGCTNVSYQNTVVIDPNKTDKLKVVTTVSPITSLVENIGGPKIDLKGLVPEGANSHTYEPAPSVASVLAAADFIVANGLFLEEPTIELAIANKQETAILLLLGTKALRNRNGSLIFLFQNPMDSQIPICGHHPLWP